MEECCSCLNSQIPRNGRNTRRKKRGRPSLLPEDITSHLTKYIHAIRDAGGIINTAIVIAAGLGIVKNVNPGLLECNGGYVVLKKSWAKYFCHH